MKLVRRPRILKMNTTDVFEVPSICGTKFLIGEHHALQALKDLLGR